MFSSIEDLFINTTIGIGVILGIVLLFFVIKCIINIINKKAFEDEYNIKLEPGFKVRKNKNEHIVNSFKLCYPKWTYSNKNGSKNKVRNNNSLIFYYSTLYFERFILRTKSPIQMIDLVKEIRDKYKDNIIEKSLEEMEKYTELKRKKDLINKSDATQTIIDSFTENPSDFETFCAELFRKMGYEAEVTQKTNDGGYDIILNKDFEKSIVECKCYAQDHSIGRPMIQKLVGANHEAKANNMKFITTSKFSKEAILFANETDVELIDGKKLIELINKYYKKTSKIVVLRSEWELNYKDLQKFYPPDVEVLKQ